MSVQGRLGHSAMSAPVSVCPKADTAGRLRPEGRTTIAIGSPRRPGPGTMRGAGARSTRCRDLNSQDGAFACLAACRARRDSSRADFCYLTRSPNNMPVRIVDYVLARSATWLARSEGFEPPTPRFEVWCSIQLSYERTDVSLAKTPADSKQLCTVEAQRLRRSRKATRSR